ncbi:sulfotransferase family 2 domain-containing protein [Synechococcus sp. MU1611]|uniref:sulfotransferase family 2 domain-containing protein n=1 Tax=Synechococcus sp. MU1611 TaxID=2508345 RepID=UPI001CF89749|nr:sulfotransferase family 2 domain-containing protein [Synechococcus sp. MU1611]
MKPSLEHSIWLKDKGIVFIFIPKVACTSWKIFLWQVMGRQLTSNITYKTVHNGQELPLPYVSNMHEMDKIVFRQKLRDGELKVCGMIREPKARVLSGYLDKVLHHRNPNSSFSRIVIPSILSQQEITEERRPTFLEFLNWNIHTNLIKGKQMNDHWRQMHQILGINKMSDLNTSQIMIWDITQQEVASKWFNKQYNTKIEFPNSQSLGHRPTNNSEKKLEKYYNASENEKFNSLYRLDVELHKAIIEK